jgi:NADPH:quinone reductase
VLPGLATLDYARRFMQIRMASESDAETLASPPRGDEADEAATTLVRAPPPSQIYLLADAATYTWGHSDRQQPIGDHRKEDKLVSNEGRSAMRAVVMDRFGGPEVLEVRDLPVPEVGPGEVLIRVEAAGVGEWDPFEREGGYAKMFGIEPRFPYILGSEGAGTVAAVGEGVNRFEEGDRVYAAGFLNPKGGFYAEYAAVDAGLVSGAPDRLPTEQAGAMSGAALTALRGLDDVLGMHAGESVAIFGASGGVGHAAVQLAKLMGARVLAVASGADGVGLVERLGADAALDGRAGGAADAVAEAARRFSPGGLDAALLCAGGEAAEGVLSAVRAGGRAAYPNGVQPEPRGGPGVRVSAYNADPDAGIIGRLDRLIGQGRFEVHVARTFRLEEAQDAHHALEGHYLGKLALRPS